MVIQATEVKLQLPIMTLARKEETGRLTAREREAWERLQQAYLRLSQNKAMAEIYHQPASTRAGSGASGGESNGAVKAALQIGQSRSESGWLACPD
jgi:hypothetical protein